MHVPYLLWLGSPAARNDGVTAGAESDNYSGERYIGKQYIEAQYTGDREQMLMVRNRRRA